MRMLGFQVVQVNSGEVNNELQALSSYKALFDGSLDEYKHEVVSLKLKEGARPILCKPRTVPLAFKKEFDKQLDQLEQLGVFEAIVNSE